MSLKIIGAGVGRTGTMSLKLALEQLGIGRCYHMVEVFGIPGAARQWLDAMEGRRVSWDVLLEGYSAAVDYPSAVFYEELARAYPEAKVILTLRDPDAWFDSTQKTIFKAIDEVGADAQDDFARMSRRIVSDAFGEKFHDRAHATAIFKAHNERVRQVIPPERLLAYEVSEGWDPLCRFLGVPVPAAPFPKVNTSEDFAKVSMPRIKTRGQS